ncbi:OsmC family protein [Ramlibacter sp.]|uniref:OsmC family protein n=1 Tax=Ramlibacter sp. TaxID=1917967 RepID=UPI0035B00A89
MATHTCTVTWDRQGQTFTDNKYSRAHAWHFDGGAQVRGSSSPHSVRVPYSDPTGVDPEEALVAATASCHMLWFLSIAAGDGWVVDRYDDAAVARMGTMPEDRRTGITEVVLHPHVVFKGRAPDAAGLDALHHRAHEACFIANSLKSEVRVEGTMDVVAE